MPRFVILLCVVLLSGGCVGASSSKTSAARVVVPAKQLPGAYGLAEWSPTREQVASCEAALAQALAKKKHDLGSYYLRLGGVVREGTRRIIGLASDKATGTHYLMPAAEDVIVLPTFGGGEAYFSFEYDSDRGKIVKLEFNAAL
jgi:hypothetical protein